MVGQVPLLINTSSPDSTPLLLAAATCRFATAANGSEAAWLPPAHIPAACTMAARATSTQWAALVEAGWRPGMSVDLAATCYDCMCQAMLSLSACSLSLSLLLSHCLIRSSSPSLSFLSLFPLSAPSLHSTLPPSFPFKFALFHCLLPSSPSPPFPASHKPVPVFYCLSLLPLPCNASPPEICINAIVVVAAAGQALMAQSPRVWASSWDMWLYRGRLGEEWRRTHQHRGMHACVHRARQRHGDKGIQRDGEPTRQIQAHTQTVTEAVT